MRDQFKAWPLGIRIVVILFGCSVVIFAAWGIVTGVTELVR